MEFRLNRMISESGFCSRREADKFIEEGRVTVNGELPKPGQKVTEHDLVLLDDLQIKVAKSLLRESKDSGFRKQIKQVETESVAKPQKEHKKTLKQASQPAAAKKATNEVAEPGKKKGLRPGKYVTYNKYAAARHAARDKAEGHGRKDNSHEFPFEEDLVKEALRPKFGKSLSRSAVAQRLASASKSASLRKTSKNNPANKAKRGFRSNPNIQDE